MFLLYRVRNERNHDTDQFSTSTEGEEKDEYVMEIDVSDDLFE